MKTVSWICIIFLIVGILPMHTWLNEVPVWYTSMWKAVVCAGGLWLAWKDYRNKSLAVWNLALIMMAIYYNPIFPIDITNSYIATPISLLTILFLIVFAYKRNSIRDTEQE